MGRTKFPRQLVASVKEHGIIVPIVVRKKNTRFEILDGNKRFDAAKEVGLTELTVHVYSDGKVRDVCVLRVDQIDRR